MDGCDTLFAATPERADASDEQATASSSDSAPLLVVPDSRARFKHWRYWLRQPHWRGAVALCSRTTPAGYLKELEALGVEAIVAGDDHVDCGAALTELRARHGIEVVRMDFGGTFIGELLRSGLVGEISVLVHPFLCGGSPKLSLFRSSERPCGEVISLALRGIEVPPNDIVWLRYEVVR